MATKENLLLAEVVILFVYGSYFIILTLGF